MVVHAFPLFKLGALLMKQISKPVANYVKKNAKDHPIFRKYVCLPPAKFYNWCEVKSKMWILNMGKPVNIPIMNEKMLIDLGAELLGESVIFIIGSALLVSEYNRNARKEEKKEEKRKQEEENLQNTLRELFIQAEEQGAHIRELTRRLGDLETKINTPSGHSNIKNNSNKTKSDPTSSPPDTPLFSPPLFDPNFPELEQNQPQDDLPLSNDSLKHDLMKNYRFKFDRKENSVNLLTSSVVLRALNEIQDDFWGAPAEREEGIVTVALNFLYKDVYRVPIKF